ncbi:MAG: Immunoglobulin I-set domain protein [Herbinix sp.]|nr:Immunoglobulin I-set domain protein [Herbinix sp.]
MKQGNTNDTVSKITIERITDTDGKKSDTVTYQEEKAVETINKLKEEGKDTARIVIPDADDVVAETTVNIPSNTLDVITKGNINLQIDTEEAKIDISKDSIVKISDNFDENLYFNLVPIKEEEQKKTVNDRAVFVVGSINSNKESNISIIGNPVTIETNMPSSEVNITLPITGVTIPSNPMEREVFLKQLAVYIEHSDGEKELVQGEIVEYKEGVYGIRFHITKFSIFTVVKTDVFTKSSESNVISVTGLSSAIISGTNISAPVENKVGSVTIKVNVSDKAVWNLYSDKACTKEITDHKIKLAVGTNKKYIKVTAEDGSEKIYTLSVTRAKSSASDVTKITIPQNAVINDKNIAAAVGNETKQITVNVTASTSAIWKLYSDKACTKELTNQKMKLNVGVNTAYLKVTAEDGQTNKIYTIKVTRDAAPVVQYNTHTKLGLIGNKTYAEKVAKIFEQDYDTDNVVVKKEGKYYRVYVDFANKAEANAACKDMIARKYIINYYFFQ